MKDRVIGDAALRRANAVITRSRRKTKDYRRNAVSIVRTWLEGEAPIALSRSVDRPNRGRPRGSRWRTSRCRAAECTRSRPCRRQSRSLGCTARRATRSSIASAAAKNRVNRPRMMQMAPTVSRNVAASANPMAGSNPCLAIMPLTPAMPWVAILAQPWVKRIAPIITRTGRAGDVAPGRVKSRETRKKQLVFSYRHSFPSSVFCRAAHAGAPILFLSIITSQRRAVINSPCVCAGVR
jgi:hypothetical protein